MKVFQALLILIVLSTAAPAQVSEGSFLKGYYVTTEDDTIRGLIDRRPEMNHYYYFLFKSGTGMESKHFPEEVKSYVIMNTVFYESYTLPDDLGHKVAGFYKTLLKGKITLLEFEKRYFGRSGKDDPFLLSIRRVEAEPPKDGARTQDVTTPSMHGKFYKTDYSGLGWLRAQMQDCPAVSNGLEAAYKTGKPDFVSIFDAYHQCIGYAAFKPEKLKKSPIRRGLSDLKRESKE